MTRALEFNVYSHVYDWHVYVTGILRANNDSSPTSFALKIIYKELVIINENNN